MTQILNRIRRNRQHVHAANAYRWCETPGCGALLREDRWFEADDASAEAAVARDANRAWFNDMWL